MDKDIGMSISKSSLNECSMLQEIYKSWDDKALYDGDGVEENYIYKCLTEGDLPPLENASIDRFNCYSIYDDNMKLVGLYNTYKGYPDDSYLWIGLFVINKDDRGKGYAKHAIDHISEEAKKSGVSKIGIGVYLKNWKGLRFWVNSGFKSIRGVHGDKEYSDKTFALISLEKIL